MNNDRALKEFKRKEKQILEEIMEKQADILDEFSKAYIAETGLKPSQCELVQEMPRIAGSNDVSFHFRKRAETFNIAIEAYKDSLNVVLKSKLKHDEGKLDNAWGHIITEFQDRLKKLEQMAWQERK